MKTKQNNTYEIYDSMGRSTCIFYEAENKKEAMKKWKEDKANYNKYCWGKLVRLYGCCQDTERRN